MTNFRVIGLDPGGTTGWAMFEADLMPDGSLHGANWRRGHIGPGDHHAKLYSFLEMSQVQHTTVVSERFEYRNDSRPGLVLVSREYIGVTKLFCQQRSVTLVEQPAGVGKCGKKTFVKETNLRRLGLWRPGWKHAMDATAHLVYYLIHKSGQQELKAQLLDKGWKPGP